MRGWAVRLHFFVFWKKAANKKSPHFSIFSLFSIPWPSKYHLLGNITFAGEHCDRIITSVQFLFVLHMTQPIFNYCFGNFRRIFFFRFSSSADSFARFRRFPPEVRFRPFRLVLDTQRSLASLSPSLQSNTWLILVHLFCAYVIALLAPPFSLLSKLTTQRERAVITSSSLNCG